MTFTDKRIDALGIVGGVGPLASAEFLKTVYEKCQWMREQRMPRVFMCSDPGFPKRSAVLSARVEKAMMRRLQKNLRGLELLGASHMVLCCVTMHHLLPRLPVARTKKVISLVEVVLKELARSPRPHIVLCSTRASRVGVFQQHPRAAALGNVLIFPDAPDQRRVQDLIAHLKRNGAPAGAKPLLDRLAKKYGTRRFICGCTEMHLLAKNFPPSAGRKAYGFLDPLLIIADTLARR